jgi:hypothetical protein
MAMSIGREGHGPSEVTCRIGGDRPGCDFMITTPGERRANTGTSTRRLMLAALGGLADVERDLIRTRTAEGLSRAKAQRKHMGRHPSRTPAPQCVPAWDMVSGAIAPYLGCAED